MRKIQKAFIWNNLITKIKHETLCNSYEDGGLKHLQDDKFDKWKLIPIHLIKSNFVINLKFHSNLDFEDSKILTIPSFM